MHGSGKGSWRCSGRASNAKVSRVNPTCTFVDPEGGGRGEVVGVPLCARLVQVRVDGQHGADRDIAGTREDERRAEGVSAEDGRSEDVCLFRV